MTGIPIGDRVGILQQYPISLLPEQLDALVSFCFNEVGVLVANDRRLKRREIDRTEDLSVVSLRINLQQINMFNAMPSEERAKCQAGNLLLDNVATSRDVSDEVVPVERGQMRCRIFQAVDRDGAIFCSHRRVFKA